MIQSVSAMPSGSNKRLYKIYADRSHHVGTLVRSEQKPRSVKNPKTDKDALFSVLFFQTLTMSEKEQYAFIRNGLTDEFGEFDKIDEFIKTSLKEKIRVIYERLKRFSRKAYLNPWNYFITITYDPKKFNNEEQFRKKLKQTLSHFHTRRNWKYMGVFERSPKERLHFHGLLYVSRGEMVGSITKTKSYNTTRKRMQDTYINDFFLEAFGRNDFNPINKSTLKNGETLEYCVKYISKSWDKIFYSRDIPTFLVQELKDNEIFGCYFEYCMKYLIFDDVFESLDMDFVPMRC